jgi:lysophospholipase L1-like esterase
MSVAPGLRSGGRRRRAFGARCGVSLRQERREVLLASEDLREGLAQVRARVPRDDWQPDLVVINQGTNDDRVFYIDTTGWLSSSDFTDSYHPNEQGSQKAAAALEAAIEALGLP